MTLVSLKKTLLLFLCIVTWKLVFSTIGTICNCHSLLPPHVWLILWGFTHTVIIPITLWMNKRNLELSTLNNTRKRAARTQMPPATAAKASQVYFVKKHFSSLTLLFHFYSLCSLLAFFSVWPGRAVALQSMPPAPLTHPHTYTSSSKTPPAPPVAFLGAHCTFKENMREA